MTEPEVARPARLALPWVESPFFAAELAARPDLPREQAERARAFHDDGYVVLRRVIEPELLRHARAETTPFFDPGGDVRAKACSFRIEDAWRKSAATRAIAAAPIVLSALRGLYEREPVPFQTLTFRRGSEQRAHLDSFVFASRPERFVAGAFVALEDCDEENGAFFVHPGSHRLLELRLETLAGVLNADDFLEGRFQRTVEALVAAAGCRARPLPLAAGDVVLFASHLAHGGLPRRDQGRSRWAQVNHYTFEGCFLYVPVHSDALTGSFTLREVVDVRTGESVPPALDGVPLRSAHAAGGRIHLDLEPAARRRNELRAAASEALEGPPGHVQVPAAARAREAGVIPAHENAGLRLHLDAIDVAPPLVSVQGWAFPPSVGAATTWSSFLVLRSDQGSQAFPALAIDRPDVAKEHALGHPRVGFEAVFDTRDLPRGRYEVAVLLVFSDGARALRCCGRAIEL